MNIVDSLIVTLGLDPSGFTKGQKDADAAQAKLKSGSLDSANQIEKANARAGESVATLGRKFLGLYVLLTAGKGVKQFVADITAADAALGRTARNLDTSGRNLSAWQNAATEAGGSAEGITGTLRGLTSEMQRAALTGQSSVIPAFRALGINLADAKGHARDATDVLRDMNKVFNDRHLDPAQFTEIAHMAGIDDGTIALLEKTKDEFNKLIGEQQKYAATAEDIDAAQKRQSGWRQLLITSQSVGRTILTAVTPAILGVMTAVQRWADANQDLIKTKVAEYAERLAGWVKSVDWNQVATDVGAFATKVGEVASAVATALQGIDGNSALTKALTALGVLAGVTIAGQFAGLAKSIISLSAIALPGWFIKMAGLAGVAVAGADAMAHLDPRTAAAAPKESTGEWIARAADPAIGDMIYGRRDANGDPEDGTEAGKKDAQTGFAGVWAKIKSVIGFGDDPKVKDGISDTAKATGEMRDLMKAQKDAVGGDGVTVSSGGVGGSGQHLSGSGSPGAKLTDRVFGRRAGSGGAGDGAGSAPIDRNLPVGNVPGATGYGTTNAYWRGPLNGKGEGGFTGPKEMFDYLKSQGATDNEALLLTGAASSESSFNPNAKHDPVNGVFTGHGLFGHKDTRLDMRGKNWQQQSVAALAEARRMLGSRINAARTPEDLADLEMHYEMPRGYHRDNPRAGDNYMGRLNSIRRFSALTGHATASAPIPTGTPTAAVTDAEVFAARQRIVNGSRDPKDQATVGRYMQEQNTPKTAVPHAEAGYAAGHDATRPAFAPMPGAQPMLPAGRILPLEWDPKTSTPVKTDTPRPSLDPAHQKLADAMNAAIAAHQTPAPTVGHAVRHALGAMAHVNKIFHHNGNPVPVEVTDKSAEKIGRAGRSAARDHTSSLARMTRMAAVSGHTMHHTVNHNSDVRVGEMHVATPSTDGRRFASEFRDDMMRRGDVTMSNGSLA